MQVRSDLCLANVQVVWQAWRGLVYIVVHLSSDRPPPAILCWVPSRASPQPFLEGGAEENGWEAEDHVWEGIQDKGKKQGESTMSEIHFFQLPAWVSADIRKN